MGLTLTIDEITQHMEEKGLMNDRTRTSMVYAQVTPSLGQALLFGAYVQLAKGKYFVMAMEEERVILIPLGKFSGKINKKVEPIILQVADLEEIIVKEGTPMHSVTFLSEENELTVKMSKVAIGMRWHKDNLAMALSELKRLSAMVKSVGN